MASDIKEAHLLGEGRIDHNRASKHRDCSKVSGDMRGILCFDAAIGSSFLFFHAILNLMCVFCNCIDMGKRQGFYGYTRMLCRQGPVC